MSSESAQSSPFAGSETGPREAASRWLRRVRPRTAFLALAIVVGSSLDALFTLLHLQAGGYEVNPLMRLALTAGVPVFLIAKTVGTGCGAVFLAAHQDLFLGRGALRGAAALYLVLLLYHGLLFARPV